jgi:hemoglobin
MTTSASAVSSGAAATPSNAERLGKFPVSIKVNAEYPAPMSEGELFEKAGGTEGVAQLVDDFYSRVFDDPELSPFFEGVPSEKLKRMQVELFSAALGGPAIYTGAPIREVHANLGIEKHHIARYVEHLLETLRSMDLDPNAVNAIYSRIAVQADDVTDGNTSDG